MKFFLHEEAKLRRAREAELAKTEKNLRGGEEVGWATKAYMELLAIMPLPDVKSYAKLESIVEAVPKGP